jgi:hypothetical protein
MGFVSQLHLQTTEPPQARGHYATCHRIIDKVIKCTTEAGVPTVGTEDACLYSE